MARTSLNRPKSSETLFIWEGKDKSGKTVRGEVRATGDAVVVRQVDFPVGTERCAVCALLEAYAMPYKYYDASGGELPASPYALSTEERATVAAAT